MFNMSFSGTPPLEKEKCISGRRVLRAASPLSTSGPQRAAADPLPERTSRSVKFRILNRSVLDRVMEQLMGFHERNRHLLSDPSFCRVVKETSENPFVCRFYMGNEKNGHGLRMSRNSEFGTAEGGWRRVDVSGE